MILNHYFQKKSFKINLINGIYNNLLKYFIFVHLLLIEDYEQGALRKKLIIAPFVGRLKTATLINFIYAYASWVNHFIFLTFCW